MTQTSTNGNIITVQQVPDSTVATDISKVFSDFGANVPISTILLGLVVVKAVAGYIRNFALKGKTAEDSGLLAKTIAHAAGNSLPSQPIVQETGQAVVPENPSQPIIPTVQTPTQPIK